MRAANWSRAALGWLVVLALGVLWEVLGRNDTTGLFPPLSDVLKESWDILSSDSLTEDIMPSIARALAGFVLGSFVGIAAGVFLGWWRGLHPWVSPTLEFCRAVPAPALVPLAVALYGSTNLVKVTIIAIGAFWPVLLHTVDGVRRVEPGFIESARVYTSGGSREILRRVVLPAATPQIMTGLRIGLAIALILMVVSEMFGASSGLGYVILQSQRLYALTTMYAGVLLLGVIGLLLTALFSSIEKKALVWYDGMKGRTQ
jgi:ABC-type nitrate/sulfonate/bicarbonate transport system permease component